MIRTPSTFTQLHAWHRDAIAGFPVERHDGIPEAGWFRMRRVKGGPFVPVRIFIERETDHETGELTEPERYVAEVEGLRADAAAIWTYLTPISREDYLALVEMHRAEDRMAATMVPMNLADTPTRPPRRNT